MDIIAWILAIILISLLVWQQHREQQKMRRRLIRLEVSLSAVRKTTAELQTDLAIARKNAAEVLSHYRMTK
jgi:hypothetical protein